MLLGQFVELLMVRLHFGESKYGLEKKNKKHKWKTRQRRRRFNEDIYSACMVGMADKSRQERNNWEVS